MCNVVWGIAYAIMTLGFCSTNHKLAYLNCVFSSSQANKDINTIKIYKLPAAVRMHFIASRMRALPSWVWHIWSSDYIEWFEILMAILM